MNHLGAQLAKLEKQIGNIVRKPRVETAGGGRETVGKGLALGSAPVSSYGSNGRSGLARQRQIELVPVLRTSMQIVTQERSAFDAGGGEAHKRVGDLPFRATRLQGSADHDDAARNCRLCHRLRQQRVEGRRIRWLKLLLQPSPAHRGGDKPPCYRAQGTPAQPESHHWRCTV